MFFTGLPKRESKSRVRRNRTEMKVPKILMLGCMATAKWSVMQVVPSTPDDNHPFLKISLTGMSTVCQVCLLSRCHGPQGTAYCESSHVLVVCICYSANA